VTQQRKIGKPMPNVSLDSIRAAATSRNRTSAAVGLPQPPAASPASPTSGRPRTRASAVAEPDDSDAPPPPIDIVEAFATDREPTADQGIGKLSTAQLAQLDDWGRPRKAARPNATKASRAVPRRGRSSKQVKRDERAKQLERQAAWDSTPRLCFDMLSGDEATQAMCRNLTGMDAATCLAFFDVCNVGGRAEDLRPYRSDNEKKAKSESAAGRKRRKPRSDRDLSAKDAYFMTLVLLEKGLDYDFTGYLFGVHRNTVMRYYIAWILYLKKVLRALMPFPTREQLEATAPPGWAEVYGTAPRVVLDATELPFQSPTALENYRTCIVIS
jgi:hypothetical protein